jgi:putative exporter of polyketide antibiotics
LKEEVNMGWVILIIALVLAAIVYVLNLDFEIGTGFSEEKRKAREAKYKMTEKAENKPPKLIE